MPLSRGSARLIYYIVLQVFTALSRVHLHWLFHLCLPFYACSLLFTFCLPGKAALVPLGSHVVHTQKQTVPGSCVFCPQASGHVCDLSSFVAVLVQAFLVSRWDG